MLDKGHNLRNSDGVGRVPQCSGKRLPHFHPPHNPTKLSRELPGSPLSNSGDRSRQRLSCRQRHGEQFNDAWKLVNQPLRSGLCRPA
ncbi:MAG: Uncharacterised protein [Cellulomonadaceae bacterium TMED98]|nr:MAG: Uncharacterised protein [Cellulomonadaceae bacterium TMED98]